MDYQRFISQLSDLYENWGQENIKPKLKVFEQARHQVQGMTTENIMQLLNFAVGCMEPDEVYCEIGTYQGSTLIGALLNHSERMAYAVDNFSEFDEDGSCQAKLLENLNKFGLEEQVYFCNQDFQQFFLELHEIGNQDKFGVYFYDGAHDYRSTLLGLLLAKPFLADQALIVLDDANWKTVQQACWDFMSASPEAKIILELPTPVARFSTFWNGIHILSWNRNQQNNYSSTTFIENRHKSVTQAIYNVQLFEQREEAIELIFKEAVFSHQQKQFRVAERQYREFLLWQEDNAQAWLNLGILYYEIEDYSEALKALLKAVKLDVENSRSYYILGCVLDKLNQTEQAIRAYQTAIELNPNLLDAYLNLGLALSAVGQIQQSEALYRQAIVKDPQFVGAYINLGNVLLEQGCLSEAIEAYQTAQQLNPDDASTAQNLAFALEAQQNPASYHLQFASQAYEQKRYQTAAKHYQEYLQLQLGEPELYSRLSQCWSNLGQVERAIEVLEAGIRQHPQSEELNYELILYLMRNNRCKKAISVAEAALSQLPDSYTLKLLKALTLPLAYDSVEEMQFYRDRFMNELQNLAADTSLDTTEQRENALAGIGRISSFYLTYQAQDMVLPQQQYAGLVQNIAAANYPQWTKPPAMPPVTGKMRIGYLSHYFHLYSGTWWLTGWLRHCSHQDFEVYCYYTGNSPDPVTQEFQEYSDIFRHIPGDLEAVCQQVLADQLHLLVFPEIGMDPGTIQLAALRLAPIQCTAWGHPITSGLPTIDYYLSSQLMEPDNAQRHYTETLIQLPNLGIAYPEPQIPPLTKTRSDFQLREDAAVYLCCQAPFKYLPQHDYLLVEIARQVSHAQFVFLRAEILKPRLKRAFATAGLDFEDYCVFLPGQTRDDYLMLNLLSDVYLDTLGFTGGNTTFDAIACGLPVVTCPGEFMRGRLSYGILQAIRVTNTIASTEAEYINLAVKLGSDRTWRNQVSEAMLEHRSQAFDDRTCIPALEDFYRQVIQERRY